MPIYEFLCADCNKVFTFFSQTVSTDKTPACPKCGSNSMRKALSKFAISGAERKSSGSKVKEPSAGGDRTGDSGADDRLSDPKVEREMMRLMEGAEGIDENNPRQLGSLLRRMSDVTGEKLTPGMDSAIRRLEAGEDVEKIEQDLGGEIEAEMGEAGLGGASGSPSYDDNVYSM